MNATEMTVRTPKEKAEFLETYAKEHATSVAEIFTRQARPLRSATRRAPHPDSLKFAGSLPVDVNVVEDSRQHKVEKH